MKSTTITLHIRDCMEKDIPFIIDYYATLPNADSQKLKVFTHKLLLNLSQPLELRLFHYLILEKDDQPLAFSLINDIKDHSAAFHFHAHPQSFRDRGLLRRSNIVMLCLKRFKELYDLNRFYFPINPNNRIVLNATENFFERNDIPYEKYMITSPERLIMPSREMVMYEFQLD